MVKKVETFVCEICGNGFDTEAEAVACEALGEPPKQKYAIGQRVILPRFGIRAAPHEIIATRVWRVSTKSGPQHARRYGVQVYKRVRWYDARSLELAD